MLFARIVFVVSPVVCFVHDGQPSMSTCSPTMAYGKRSSIAMPTLAVQIDAGSGGQDAALHGSAVVPMEEDTSHTVQPPLRQDQSPDPTSTTVKLEQNPMTVTTSIRQTALRSAHFNYTWSVATATPTSGISRVPVYNNTAFPAFRFPNITSKAHGSSSVFSTARASAIPGDHPTIFAGSGPPKAEITSPLAIFVGAVLAVLLFT